MVITGMDDLYGFGVLLSYACREYSFNNITDIWGCSNLSILHVQWNGIQLQRVSASQIGFQFYLSLCWYCELH